MAGDQIRVRMTAKDETGAAFRSANAGINRLSVAARSLATVVGPLAGAVAAISFVRLGRESLDFADRIHKLSLATSVSAEALSQYKHVAELSGTSFETMGKALVKMQKNMSDAEDGLSTAKRAFAEIGMKVEDLRKLAPETAFETIGAAINDIEGPARRTQVAMALFGKAGSELIPVFAGGAAGVKAMRDEADRLGLTMDAVGVEKAAAANDAMTRLDHAFDGMAQTIAIGLAPALTSVVDQIGRDLPAAIAVAAKKTAELRRQLDELGVEREMGDSWWDKITDGISGAADQTKAVFEPMAMNRGPVQDFTTMWEKVADVRSGAAAPAAAVIATAADAINSIDNTKLKDFTSAVTGHDIMMGQMDQVETLTRFWSTATAGMGTVAEQSDATFVMMADAAEGGADRMADAISNAVFESKDLLESLGGVARSIFGTIFSGFLRLGVSSAISSIFPPAAVIPGADFIGPIKSSNAGGQSAKAGGATVNGDLVVNVAGAISPDDPISVRRLAEALDAELKSVAAQHGPED